MKLIQLGVIASEANAPVKTKEVALVLYLC